MFYIIDLVRSQDAGHCVFWAGEAGYVETTEAAGAFQRRTVEGEPNRYDNGIDTIAVPIVAFDGAGLGRVSLERLTELRAAFERKREEPSDRREVWLGTTGRLPEIYIFVNGGGFGAGDVCGDALSEDGEFLAGHLSSGEGWLRHDMGLVGDWKHENYTERYPGGFCLVWIANPREDQRIKDAHAKHVAAGKEGTPWQRERAAKKSPNEDERRAIRQREDVDTLGGILR